MWTASLRLFPHILQLFWNNPLRTTILSETAVNIFACCSQEEPAASSSSFNSLIVMSDGTSTVIISPLISSEVLRRSNRFCYDLHGISSSREAMATGWIAAWQKKNCSNLGPSSKVLIFAPQRQDQHTKRAPKCSEFRQANYSSQTVLHSQDSWARVKGNWKI